MDQPVTYTAFLGLQNLASGPLENLLPPVKAVFDQDPGSPILIFHDQTGRQVDFELRGTLAEVLTMAAPPAPRTGPGRPKLGVVSREISLLPRHWEWLEQQPNGASAALRRLIDHARQNETGAQRARPAKDATNRVMTALAGNLPGYEEATRALYRGEAEAFASSIAAWPPDLSSYLARLAADAFDSVPAAT